MPLKGEIKQGHKARKVSREVVTNKLVKVVSSLMPQTNPLLCPLILKGAMIRKELNKKGFSDDIHGYEVDEKIENIKDMR